ncbi:transposase [Halomonas stenophila]|uniref:transposase n=1 Tax=Halomonas stenophila TaxID=795312 RepID=UPI003CCD5DD1
MPSRWWRWVPGQTNARLEGMNGLFQAAQSHARGYRNEANFVPILPDGQSRGPPARSGQIHMM